MPAVARPSVSALLKSPRRSGPRSPQGWGGPALGPRKRLGPRRDALVSRGSRAMRAPASIPGGRGTTDEWEREAAATWRTPGGAPPPGGGPTCGARAVAGVSRELALGSPSRRAFCPDPWASPAACLQFWPLLGARVAGLDSFLDSAFSANSGERFQGSVERPRRVGGFSLWVTLG